MLISSIRATTPLMYVSRAPTRLGNPAWLARKDTSKLAAQFGAALRSALGPLRPGVTSSTGFDAALRSQPSRRGSRASGSSTKAQTGLPPPPGPAGRAPWAGSPASRKPRKSSKEKDNRKRTRKTPSGPTTPATSRRRRTKKRSTLGVPVVPSLPSNDSWPSHDAGGRFFVDFERYITHRSTSPRTS